MHTNSDKGTHRSWQETDTYIYIDTQEIVQKWICKMNKENVSMWYLPANTAFIKKNNNTKMKIYRKNGVNVMLRSECYIIHLLKQTQKK